MYVPCLQHPSDSFLGVFICHRHYFPIPPDRHAPFSSPYPEALLLSMFVSRVVPPSSDDVDPLPAQASSTSYSPVALLPAHPRPWASILALLRPSVPTALPTPAALIWTCHHTRRASLASCSRLELPRSLSLPSLSVIASQRCPPDMCLVPPPALSERPSRSAALHRQPSCRGPRSASTVSQRAASRPSLERP